MLKHRIGGETGARGGRLSAAVLAGALVLSFACSDKIQSRKIEVSAGLPEPANKTTATRESQPIWHRAVGTVRSRTETTVAARVTGTLEAVYADVGSTIRAGQILATIDQREVKARLAQAKSALLAAEAEAARATAEERRTTQLHAKEAATPAQYEAAQASRQQADAGVVIAREKVREAEVALNYSRIASPIAGRVAERRVEAGDLAKPGEPMFLIHDPQDLRLEADVREGLIGEIEVEDVVIVELPALGREVEARVDEIVPAADPRSRTFLIKVALPPQDGLFPGMFGRLRLGAGSRESVFVPAEAVERVGQLLTVLVLDDGRWKRRYITAGDAADDRIEILSGLDGGETIGWDR